jgi:serine/threonine protein kinase
MDTTPKIPIGERLDDRFEITEVLPAGGMGEVYRARDTKLQRDVAIKLLLGTALHDHQRFIREAQAGAAFKHANVVSIYDFGTFLHEGHDRPYLVMEFIEGTTLRDRMGKASKDQIIRWLSEVADGLQELHQKGFIHRDVKPSNIMIGTTDNRARIVDFGLAKTEGATITTTNTIVGTIDYLSPEQTEGKPLDFRTDIFSFGIVLYEALTGRHPFHRPKDYHTIHAINFEFPQPIREPEGVIVARCLQKNPIKRYDSAADIASALRELRPTPSRNSAPTEPSAVDQDASTVRIDSTAPHGRWRWYMTAGFVAILLVSMMEFHQKVLPGVAPRIRANTAPATAAAQQLPTCGLTATPGTMTFGESAKLRWSSSNAVDAVISPAIGIVGPNGTMDVSPRVTTTYHLVVTTAKGIVAESSVTLLVTGAPADLKVTPATGSIIASPATITHQGEVAELRWNSFGATHVVITPSIGIVPLQGRIQVAPTVTTTYTMSINNDTGDNAGRGSATVYVDPAGAPTGIVANPLLVLDCIAATQPGTSGMLVTDSTSCSVPAHRTVTQATLTYILDDGGTISVNGRNVFTKTPGLGAREGTVTLPVGLFPPNNSFQVEVQARNAVNPDGRPAENVYGKAAVHLATIDSLAAVGMTASPRVIRKGETAHLNWSSTDATMLVLNPLVGIVDPYGGMTVSPTETTTYTLHGWNASGDLAKGSVTLEVQPPALPGTMQQARVTPQTAVPGPNWRFTWVNCAGSIGSSRLVKH